MEHQEHHQEHQMGRTPKQHLGQTKRSKRIIVLVTPDLFEQVRRDAAAHDLSMSARMVYAYKRLSATQAALATTETLSA